MEVACQVSEDTELHPLSFRVHTHKLGLSVSGWSVRKEETLRWHLLGKENPQLPQMFYPVHDRKLVIGKGDILAARYVP